MTVVAWPRMRAQVIAIAIAGALVGATASNDVEARTPRHGASQSHQSAAGRRTGKAAKRERGPRAASASMVRTNSLLEFDNQQRDGHMTPEERKLLRQHIEDAVRELYGR